MSRTTFLVTNNTGEDLVQVTIHYSSDTATSESGAAPMPNGSKLYLNASGGDNTQQFCLMLGGVPVCGVNLNEDHLKGQMVGRDNFVVIKKRSSENDYTITINGDFYPLQVGGQSCFFEPTWFTTKKAPEGES